MMQGEVVRDAFWQFERDGWQRAAAHYEASWSALTRLFIPPLLRALRLEAGARLLDVCCGPGYVAEAAHRAGASVVGVDFAAAMVRRARERVGGVEFREGDAQQLPFTAAAFDAVAMSFGVPHLADPEAAFAEARRVLRPGGRFAFTVWARPEVNPLAQIVDEAIEAHADTSVDLPEGPPYFRFADREECRETLAKVGFAPDSLSFEAVTVKWRVPTAETLFEAERVGGVRTAAVLAGQAPQRLDAIRSAVAGRVTHFAREGGFAIPATAHVVAVATPDRT